MKRSKTKSKSYSYGKKCPCKYDDPDFLEEYESGRLVHDMEGAYRVYKKQKMNKGKKPKTKKSKRRK